MTSEHHILLIGRRGGGILVNLGVFIFVGDWYLYDSASRQ